ncbi:MAG TPA: tRNA (adenosine(37)-N6)-threonylcarbamoyltransferase complex transferase subunit TsaD [Acidobacteriota bacterium]|jgi:N6-L-threonylcarbamoyladenine synthase|nr:tRNA (adenosine(37)-N6)-threonylcarbamoyltransferase complex transferase subunit TsaD [Acidobacteriota bacterium]HNR38811.1 tRNA (adenosine(37)-N6)-threonylcarbamoyltransferase complex transferase subunit TsaD [Acidobacteriota bacterium]HNU00332.1 tRNA (adenosine(37)-N6)-threonylcarbamoyltransferase complex transferase subunit TsaD [Acidobacteriota bacterium]HPB27199.1 tRNA (adenosine(37)-N6)-threonylcarbamoyltransferase complex transferase subunit TsaD [Acidobacteriota bacterium]HQO25004.1 
MTLRADGPPITLGIESSCDETSAAVLDRDGRPLANVVASQIALHAPYGGVVPELAARAHIRNIRPVVAEALRQAGIERRAIGLVAVTQGPGLIGSLLVGLSYAKALARVLEIPVVGVNHLEGHFFSPFLEHPDIRFPLIALVVSGGHSSLYYTARFGSYERLAATRDDAAGEAYDKVAKLLGLPYPGGPFIDRAASNWAGDVVAFAPPKISDGSLDFSFSGLKTAVLYRVQKERLDDAAVPPAENPAVLAILKGFQRTVVGHLLHRVRHFSLERRPRSLILCGGVACNSELRRRSIELGQELGIDVFHPSSEYTTDNAAMIAAAGRHAFATGRRDSLCMNAFADLPLVSAPPG